MRGQEVRDRTVKGFISFSYAFLSAHSSKQMPSDKMKIPNLKEGDYAMKERFIENGIEYVRNGDYYIPNLKAPEGKYNIGKYGRLHSIFIKENRPCLYSMKMLNGTWLAYLEEIDTTAKEMINKLIKDMAVKQGITEELKAKDQMAWERFENCQFNKQ
ncbi:MAG: TnpV protein [Ruminococcaceae bacterium]|nr:TnpV protein [Oscillospiraceae bacterium]